VTASRPLDVRDIKQGELSVDAVSCPMLDDSALSSVAEAAAPEAAAPGFGWPDSELPRAPEVASRDPNMAVRARLNAIVLDGVILGLAIRLLLSALGAAARSPDALLLLLGLQFVYFFAFEAATGQTIGKRVCHIHVVGLDGTPVTARQAAIRNVLRFADALPILYASGLLSMMRTGRERRQRIGDVAAGTIVVVDTAGRPLRTPRWLLPVATLVATLASVGLLIVVLHAPSNPQIPAATGFAGNTSERPVPGSWQAIGTTTSAIGYGADPVGEQFDRAWMIARTCTPSGDCSFELTRQLAGEPPLTARLILAPNGWHATFPLRQYSCGSVAGQTIYWLQHSSWVLRFTNAGRTAEANERNFSYTPACGYGTDTVEWTATHL
jgi:uncharacterized RDD family membrane protein YckC